MRRPLRAAQAPTGRGLQPKLTNSKPGLTGDRNTPGSHSPNIIEEYIEAAGAIFPINSSPVEKESSAPSADETATPASEEPGELNPYRVRVKQMGAPRTRVSSLVADSLDEARSLAMVELGNEWEVLDVDAA